MDLAKIRKKSLQMLKESGDRYFTAPSSASMPATDAFEQVTTAPSSAEADFFQPESEPTPVAGASSPAHHSPAQPPVSVPPPCSPLEAILAGRRAAGCAEESVPSDDVVTETVVESFLEFLCFRVSDEIYGINIMDIKEIIKPREVTEVPHAPDFVAGILSLRGTIIPVIDMRIRLGLASNELTGKERIVVIKNNSNSFSGLLVDEVIKVVQVPLDAVEAAPAVLDGINRDFVNGLGRSEGRLIIILNLQNIADIHLC